MAEAGIKISDLPEVKAQLDDETVIVQASTPEGLTRKTRIGSIIDLLEPGTTGGIYNRITSVEEKASSNETKINEVTISAATALINSNKNYSLLMSLDNTLTSLNQDINERIDKLDTSVKAISVLTDSPEMLSSLTSMIALLSGEDGQAQLSNMAKSILDISADLANTKDYVLPTLNLAKYNLQNLLDNQTNTNSFRLDTNSFLSTVLNEEYNYSYDKKCPQNVLVLNGYLNGELSGKNSENIVMHYDLSPKEISEIDINELETSYTTSVNFIIREETVVLSNAFLISTVSYENTQDALSSISTFYDLELDEEGDILTVDTTTTTEKIEIPGETTFSLNMIPIRAGMFDKNTYSFSGKISGISDVDIFFANGASILSGYKCKLDILVNNEKILKKSGLDKVLNDTELELGFSKRLRGGDTITFKLENEITSLLDDSTLEISNQDLSTYSLIGAIRSCILPSEQKELEIAYLSAWTEYEIDGGNRKYLGSKIKATLYGGADGDVCELSVFCLSNDTGTPVQIPLNGEASKTLDKFQFDNSYLIDNMILSGDGSIEPYNIGYIPANNTVEVVLKRQNNDGIVRNSTKISLVNVS